MKIIKVMPLLQKNKNVVAKGAVEFPNDLPGWQLGGFTICENDKKELYVLFPSNRIEDKDGNKKNWYYLRPMSETSEGRTQKLEELESEILDIYQSMIGEVSK